METEKLLAAAAAMLGAALLHGADFAVSARDVRTANCGVEIVSVAGAPGGVKYKVDAQTENVVFDR